MREQEVNFLLKNVTLSHNKRFKKCKWAYNLTVPTTTERDIARSGVGDLHHVFEVSTRSSLSLLTLALRFSTLINLTV